MTVALLAAVESLLSAVVADGMSGDHHNSNVELVAQGVANMASPLFGGIPATGAIARTATNIRSGALTPVAGMVHALTLLLILLVAAPLARFVPLAALASVLFVVSYNMSEWREVTSILRLSGTAIAVWVTTFVLTVVADLTVAVGVGMGLAALLYIYRVAETTTVAQVTPEYLEDGQPHILQDKMIPTGDAGPGRVGQCCGAAAAQYVCAGWDRSTCHRTVLDASAEGWQDAAVVRCAGTAVGDDLTVGPAHAYRAGECAAAYPGCAGACAGDSGRLLGHWT